METTQEDPSSRKDSGQLNLLLLKAESYSKFILDNQKRSQAIFANRMAASAASNTTSKKRISSDGCGEMKSKRVKADVTTTSLSFDQPPNLSGGTLMGHQLEGLQWLLSLWENGLNGILADEMGLGKTIQIIALIAHLRHHKTAGPYLIIGPLATLGNWVKEFQKWLPECPIVLYHGDKTEREVLRRTKLPMQNQKSLEFPVVITSFEMCMSDRAHLERYLWQYLIMDEGHRIKNRKCKLFRDLKTLRSTSRLLLTGTPIQNSLEELWSLLNFCSPMIFDDLEVFQSWFGFKNIGQETKVEDIVGEQERDQVVTKLHDILRPFVLRRMKKDVLGESHIMQKREVVIYCGMTQLQSEYYGRVVDGTLRDELLRLGVDGRYIGSNLNPLMNQRKVCNHPFLFGPLPGVDEQDDCVYVEQLMNASGKFKLLQRVLPRLKAEGHKTILFSQMTEVLSLIEDYCHLQGYRYCRLDGNTKLQDRQDSINAFNEDPELFLFLLSTRAGGLGVNLTAADTVVLFDSDWNPHMDAQAQDRCHRIGQRRNVVVYRLLTSGSVEIEMMKKQVSKRKLERLAIHGGDFRHAGKRKGSMTLEGLRKLLADDVKSLSRQEFVQDRGQTAAEWLRRDISEEELELLLDRDCIFADEDTGESLPAEGEMYDIVSAEADSLLQSLD